MMNMEKFFSNIIPEPNSGCWIWLGPVFAKRRRSIGYGRYGKTNKLAHRVSWEVHNGALNGEMVCHSCDTPLCVNPDHLFLGSAASNMADKVSKSRQARGGRIRHSALDESKVRQILSRRGDPIPHIAADFGTSYGVIWNVLNDYSWRWVKL